MTGNENSDKTNDQLDQLGRALLLHASASNEAEAEAVVASPFAYTRLRARIAAEQERRSGGDTWLALLGLVWRSVPAMALVAVFAFILFWTSSFGTTSPGVLSDEALLDARDAGIENVMFADRRALSSDDVLATIIQGDERENSR
ncbi:MAG: hypothetical protein LC747_05205 [Acidobacteria bacterium]|nr:hypothetical protein [Acidobacteriota bacterium]